jgi:hypothetical protein
LWVPVSCCRRSIPTTRSLRAEAGRRVVPAKVDRLEWLGAERSRTSGAEEAETSASSGLREVAGELHEARCEEHEALTIARIDPASEIAEGGEAELWLDTSRATT